VSEFVTVTVPETLVNTFVHNVLDDGFVRKLVCAAQE
jgi:hypothetical protein